MTIHVLQTNFTISREMPLDSGRCHDFAGFSCNCVASGDHLKCVYSIDQALSNIIELIKVMREPQ